MTKISELEKMDSKQFEKPKGRELVFIPKNEFLNWYKHTKGINDVEMLRIKGEYKECPNCKGSMETYKLDLELWNLCPHCNYTISERQRDSFAMIILRALNGE